MFGFNKKSKSKDGIKTQKTDIKLLYTDMSAALDTVEALSSDELLSRLDLTRESAVSKVQSDDEVESCLIDLRAAMSAANWRIWGDDVDDETINPLYKNLRHHLPVFIELAIMAKLNGYAVAEYLYQQDEHSGLITLSRVINKSGELQYYTPKRDGRLIFSGGDEELSVDLRVKHLFLSYLATASKPAGVCQAAKLYPAVQLRSMVLPYAGQFIRRYAQPFVIGKQGGFGDLNKFVNDLFAFLSGGALALGKDDEVAIHQLSGDAEAFRTLEKIANARIQKMLLGKVKTADLHSGSRAAQQTEEINRIERISEYLSLLAGAVQHALDAILQVNADYAAAINAPAGLWFEFEDEIKIDTARAERDKHYLDSGQVRFSKDYYTQILGFEEGHIEMLSTEDSAAAPADKRPADKRKLAEAMLSQDSKAAAPLNPDELAIMQPRIEAIMAALDECQDYREFESKLAALDISDELLIQTLARQNAIAYTDGAVENDGY